MKLSGMIRLGLTRVEPRPLVCLRDTGPDQLCGCLVGAALVGAVLGTGQEFDYKQFTGHLDKDLELQVHGVIGNTHAMRRLNRLHPEAFERIAPMLHAKASVAAPGLLRALQPRLVAHAQIEAFRLAEISNWSLMSLIAIAYDRNLVTAEELVAYLEQDGL